MENTAIAKGLTLITGPVSSGKTTVAKALVAANYFDGPKILEDDRKLTGKDIRAALKTGHVIVTSEREDVLARVGFKKRPERHLRIELSSDIPE